MKWGKRKVGGVTYDLTHLDPFILDIPPHGDGEQLKARVRFGSHTFTLKWDDNYIEEYRIKDGKKSRCFCPVRHGHSKHLPGILQLACAGRVLFDPDQKLVMLGNPPGAIMPYAVFFEMTAARRQTYELDIVVVSAHNQPHIKAKLGMPFPQLARIVADGGAIPWPKKAKK
jgi:hypothetical protein